MLKHEQPNVVQPFTATGVCQPLHCTTTKCTERKKGETGMRAQILSNCSLGEDQEY